MNVVLFQNSALSPEPVPAAVGEGVTMSASMTVAMALVVPPLGRKS